MPKKFTFYKQSESKDCGPTCLRMVAKSYGKDISITEIRALSETTREGSNLLHITACAEALGFHTLAARIDIAQLPTAPLPCILHWRQNHYVVLLRVYKPLFSKSYTYEIADPAFGILTYAEEDFKKQWSGGMPEGIALLLDPTPAFYKKESATKSKMGSIAFLWGYLQRYKSYVVQIVLGLAAGSALQLVVPFLTQSVVDVGIAQRDIGFVYLILAAQLALFVGRTTVEVLRSWILLHLSTRINISLISDFFIKLMALPIAYFDVKMTGDLMQRINDHQRIERILTTSSLSILFSMVNLVVFSVVLALYSWAILGVFAVGSALYLIWILVFFKKRKALDYKKFSEVSQEQGKVIELINGMQEIKLHNAERQKRWGWEHVQARLFKVTIESLALEQYQSVGSNFINELKNIIITILAAGLVISGELTLGMMVATSYIVGQLNAPIMQLIGFLREWQDAKIAIERLSEIHDMEDEQPAGVTVRDIPIDANLRLKNVSFRYPGSDTPVLIDLNLHIPAKKVTAIVGTSGSGKTTLLKMLLGHYVAQSGSINIGDVPIQEVSKRQWRQKCGVVMQEGYIFNDSVAGNVALGDASIDEERLALALKLANIHEFVAALPQYHRTKIGQEGVGLSTGQKQRLFIARAVYKNPEYLFFDEATSALDANNEQQIMRNLNQYFKNKTVVVVAHRLSTVKNADQIVVLEKGKIAEIGTHTELVALRGLYYELVKNQLELGN